MWFICLKITFSLNFKGRGSVNAATFKFQKNENLIVVALALPQLKKKTSAIFLNKFPIVIFSQKYFGTMLFVFF